MTSSANAWIVDGFRGRQLQAATPSEEWAAAERALADAESRGDQQAIDEANRQLDELDRERRERAADVERDAGQSMRSSSGVRQPLRRQLSPNQAMDQAILRLTGRAR